MSPRPSVPHESALAHVTGRALYTDDLPLPPGTLAAWPACSPHARARILRVDTAPALAVPGVEAVLLARDVPGRLEIGALVHDEPLLARDEVGAEGQPVALVVGRDVAACRLGAERLVVEWEPLPPILSIPRAIEAGSFIGRPHVIARGDVDAALRSAPLLVQAELHTPPQEHFYLETQAAIAIPGEDGTLGLLCSTQHPTEVQRMAARVLGIGDHRVCCEVRRLGGGFGGKEAQATQVACLAALAAFHTGRPVKLRYDRALDMRATGKRHPFLARYSAAFDREGRLLGLRVALYADAGCATDLSPAILDRALFHLDGAYHVPALRFEGRLCRTNTPSNTAFRGFGGPQGTMVVEDALNRAAERLGADPAHLRRLNLYGPPPRHLSPYGEPVRDNRLPRIARELLATSDYLARRSAIDDFNRTSAERRRGIGLQLVKFGISFTAALLNQAGALVLVYTDGTVQLNHAGVEMGQGLHTKMLAVCAAELGLPPERVRVLPTGTDKVPNTPPTAASSGSDLNGQAVREACGVLRERLRPVVARMLGIDPAMAARLVFGGGRVSLPDGRGVSFAQAARRAWEERVPLSATGFYATPGIHYDRASGRGNPFYYYAFGGAVTEVEVDGLTGCHRLLRADILHDAGDSLVPGIDRGQVEGAFVQGLGWLLTEELLRDERGRLLTAGPSTYKLPAAGDLPPDMRVALLQDAAQPGVVGGSKAVGEPPFLLAISAWTALRHALASWAGPGREIELRLPATPESVLDAIEELRSS